MNKEKIYYERGTEELKLKGRRVYQLLQTYNNLTIDEFNQKEKIISELFGTVGVNPSIEHNFHCDLGYNIHVGDNFYAGYNCTILDMADVRIGDNCMIGPDVGIYTAGHSIKPKDRNKGGYAIPITIGNDVWIGGGEMMSGLVAAALFYLASQLEITLLLQPDQLSLKMFRPIRS